VQHELARTLDDVLQRRLRVSLRHPEAGGVGIDRAADVMASVLGWDDAERRRQVDEYLRSVRDERGVVPLPPSAALRS
jgi:glycerol-3-phosphate dehydrogenase